MKNKREFKKRISIAQRMHRGAKISAIIGGTALIVSGLSSFNTQEASLLQAILILMGIVITTIGTLSLLYTTEDREIGFLITKKINNLPEPESEIYDGLFKRNFISPEVIRKTKSSDELAQMYLLARSDQVDLALKHLIVAKAKEIDGDQGFTKFKEILDTARDFDKLDK